MNFDTPIKEDHNCEIYTIIIPNDDFNSGCKLPDISADKFKEYVPYSGASDIEYDKYKTKNKMKDITDFDGETIKELSLVLEDGFRQRRIVFKAIYDSEWETGA